MSLRIDTVDRINGIAIVRVRTCSERALLGEFIRCWRALETESATLAVAVVPLAGDFSVALPADARDLVTIAPKSVGLLKPIGVGLRGSVFDYGLQLVGEADTVIATSDARIADTSVAWGIPAVHVGWLHGSLPDAEINRLALLGEPNALTAARAAELGLVDEIVDLSNLETSLIRRLQRYVAAETPPGE